MKRHSCLSPLWTVLIMAVALSATAMVLRPWYDRWMVARLHNQIARLPADELCDTFKRLAGSERLAVPLFCESLSASRLDEVDAAHEGLLSLIDRWERESITGGADSLARLAHTLAGSVNRYGPVGRQRARQIARRLLFWSTDLSSVDWSPLVADCETILLTVERPSKDEVTSRPHDPRRIVRTRAMGRLRPAAVALGEDDARSGSHPTADRDRAIEPTGVAVPNRHADGPAQAHTSQVVTADYEVTSDLPPGFLGPPPLRPPVDVASHRVVSPSGRSATAADRADPVSSASSEPGPESTLGRRPTILVPPRNVRRLPPGDRRSKPNRTGPTPLPPPGRNVSPTAETGRPIEHLPTRDVIRRLGDRLSPAGVEAEAELVARGMTDVQLNVARQLADPDRRVRERLIDHLSELHGIDARQWLVWLSRDEEAGVRRAAISVMATSDDPVLLLVVERLVREDPDHDVAAYAERLLERRRESARP